MTLSAFAPSLVGAVAAAGCGSTGAKSTSPEPPEAGAAEAGGPIDCPGPARAVARAADRTSCRFVAGAMPADTLDLTPAEEPGLPIRHVIVLMKENRSFDHFLGRLAARGQPGAELLPDDFANLDLAGVSVAPFHLMTTCLADSPNHQWDDMHQQVDGGKMGGFITSTAPIGGDGHFVMGYYDESDLPFDYFLANTFAVGDRAFASVRSGTWPNRDYLLFATSDGVLQTGGGHVGPDVPSIFDSLDRRAVSWASYTDTAPFEDSLGWEPGHVGVRKLQAFRDELAQGSLPAVSFVDGLDRVTDDHPPADVQKGEAWNREIYEAVVASPLWPSTVLILTYDEGGGFADHVPPPESCVARPADAAFFELGVRVPLLVVSPWARRHYVSHVVHEHTSILRFIELVFGLPALTARDANSDALLDMFDFACTMNADAPRGPDAGIGGCR